VLPLAVTTLACSIIEQVTARDACMLQQETIGMRATRKLHDDLEYARSKQAPQSASKTAKLAPHRHPIVTRIGPITGGKIAPRAKGKTSRAPKTSPKPTGVPPTWTTSTTSTTSWWEATIPDFGDDETVSKQVELSIKPTLEEINLGPNGPLEEFSETFKRDILKAMEVRLDRMYGLRMNDKAENEGSQIDFGVTAGKPSAGRSVGNLAVQLADKRSSLMNGSLRKILFGAVMVVSEGSQSNHPTLNWYEKQRPKNSIIKQIETKLGIPWAVCVQSLRFASYIA